MDVRGAGRFWRQVGRLVQRNPIGAFGAAIIVTVGLTAALAGSVSPFDPTAQIAGRLEPPSNVHVWGTDEFGRDVLSRVVYGSRISLYVGAISVTIALLVGATMGLVAGYFGGYIDNTIMRIVDVMFSVPSAVLAIAITGILGPNLTNAMIAIGIAYAPTFARVARGAVLSVVEEVYIEAARAIGTPNRRIILRHILPNVMAPLVVQTTLSLSTAILMEAALSFLGLGTQPPHPSWGSMLGAGRKYMEIAPWTAVFPGLAIMFTVLGFNLFGDGLRDAMDPRLRGV